MHYLAFRGWPGLSVVESHLGFSGGGINTPISPGCFLFPTVFFSLSSNVPEAPQSTRGRSKGFPVSCVVGSFGGANPCVRQNVWQGKLVETDVRTLVAEQPNGLGLASIPRLWLKWGFGETQRVEARFLIQPRLGAHHAVRRPAIETRGPIGGGLCGETSGQHRTCRPCLVPSPFAMEGIQGHSRGELLMVR